MSQHRLAMAYGRAGCNPGLDTLHYIDLQGFLFGDICSHTPERVFHLHESHTAHLSIGDYIFPALLHDFP